MREFSQKPLQLVLALGGFSFLLVSLLARMMLRAYPISLLEVEATVPNYSLMLSLLTSQS